VQRFEFAPDGVPWPADTAVDLVRFRVRVSGLSSRISQRSGGMESRAQRMASRMA